MFPDFTQSALVAVLGVSTAVNGFFLREAWRELRELRAADRAREVALAEVTARVDVISSALPLTPSRHRT